MNTNELEQKANELRRTIIQTVYDAGAGHLGGSLSWADLGTVLFFDQMELHGEDKDRFILSKGHAVPTLYSLLALKDELSHDQLKTLRQIDSPLEGHPVVGTHPLIYASTGALGQGLSMGLGYSLADKLKGSEGRTYVLMGDGECQEGQVWEAAMLAPTLMEQRKINGITAIVDYNKVQGDNYVANTMPSFAPLADKWESFGWYVQEIDGHDVAEIKDAYQNAKGQNERPAVIIANTKKGAGVSFMEGDPIKWHGSALDSEHYARAMNDLGGVQYGG